MKPDLSSIINDLITGKAKLRDEYFTFTAGAGAAVGPTTFFECPSRTLRLLLSVQLQTVKTTGTLCWLYLNTTGYLVLRTIGEDILNLPTDDGSDKDEAEVSANTILLMKPKDSMIFFHELTAAETISDLIYTRFIEWSGVDVI